jgi:hypothetical protein
MTTSDADPPTEPAVPPPPSAPPDPASARLALACRGAAAALPATFASTFLRLALVHGTLAAGTLIFANAADPDAAEPDFAFAVWTGWIAPFAEDVAFWFCLAFAARRSAGAASFSPRGAAVGIASCLLAGGLWKCVTYGSSALIARVLPPGGWMDNPLLWFAAATALRAVHALGMFGPAAATVEGLAPLAALKRGLSLAVGIAVAAGFAWTVVRAAAAWTAAELTAAWFAGPAWGDYAGALGTYALLSCACDALRASLVGGAYAALTRRPAAE